MPIPKPRPGESRGEFVSRCVSQLVKEDPKLPNEQRVAVCFSAWTKAKGDN